MNITCTQCQTTFSVPDGLIPPEGRRVRCANPECRTIFQAYPVAVSSPKPLEPEPLFAGPQEPEPTSTPAPTIAPTSAAPQIFPGFDDTGSFRTSPFSKEEDEALAKLQADQMTEELSHRDLLFHQEVFPQSHRLDAEGDLSFDFVLPRRSAEEPAPPPPATPEPPQPKPSPAVNVAPQEHEEADRLDPLPEEQPWEVENRQSPSSVEEDEAEHPPMGRGWWWASVAMIALTLGGLGWMYRDAVFASPLIADTLASLGLAPTVAVEGIAVTGPSGSGIPEGQLIHSEHLGDLYIIRGKILNKDGQPHPLPWLDVTLTGAKGETVQHLQILPEPWDGVAPLQMQMVHYTRWLDHATHPRSPWPALAGGESGDFVVFFRAIDNTLASVNRYAITLIPGPAQ